LVLLSRRSVDDARSSATQKEDAMVELDMSNNNAAYRCGRLLAAIEETQRLALPEAKAGVVDRFYGTASAAPASVFGRLLRGVGPHLAKLERDKPGLFYLMQTQLEEIQSGLTSFPKVLNLQDQGLFALGYYHQCAYIRTRKRVAAERRGTEPAPGEERAGESGMLDDCGSTSLYKEEQKNGYHNV
jgi:CRISPR-associated protein Csd1